MWPDPVLVGPGRATYVRLNRGRLLVSVQPLPRTGERLLADLACSTSIVRTAAERLARDHAAEAV